MKIRTIINNIVGCFYGFSKDKQTLVVSGYFFLNHDFNKIHEMNRINLANSVHLMKIVVRDNYGDAN